MNNTHLTSIKTAQVFEFIGEIMCLVGATFIMMEAIQDGSLNLMCGSLFVGVGNVSMIVQSVMTMRIPDQVVYDNVKKRKNTDETESV